MVGGVWYLSEAILVLAELTVCSMKGSWGGGGGGRGEGCTSTSFVCGCAATLLEN